MVVSQAQDSALKAAQAKVHPLQCIASLVFCFKIPLQNIAMERDLTSWCVLFHDRRISVHRRRHEEIPCQSTTYIILSNQQGMTARNGYGHCYCITTTAPGQSSGAAESCTRSGRRGSTKGRVDFSGRLSTQSFTIYVHNVHGEKYFKHFCFFYARRFFNIAVDSNP